MNIGASGAVPQSKWGRHCCRPHSHRPVVSSSGEPSDERLAPDASPSLRQAEGPVLSPALAPASGSARGLAGPETCPRLARPRARRSMLAIHLERYSRPPKRSRIPSMSGRNVRLIEETRGGVLRRPACLRPKPLQCVPRTLARTFSAISSGVEKSFVFRSFDRQLKSFPFPSDVLRLRPRSESGKLCKVDLSTFPRFRGGYGWITERFVAGLARSRQRTCRNPVGPTLRLSWPVAAAAMR